MASLQDLGKHGRSWLDMAYGWNGSTQHEARAAVTASDDRIILAGKEYKMDILPRRNPPSTPWPNYAPSYWRMEHALTLLVPIDMTFIVAIFVVSYAQTPPSLLIISMGRDIEPKFLETTTSFIALFVTGTFYR